MSHVSNTNFGLLIAYLIPGFLGVFTVKPYSAALASWMATSPDASPTVGGFLFVTVSAVFLGLLASTIRWLILDPLHRKTGLPRPSWDFQQLEEHITAFQLAVEQHYRYYQFYGNTLIVAVVAALTRWPYKTAGVGEQFLLAVGVLAFFLLLFVASRDALRKYYDRSSSLAERTKR